MWRALAMVVATGSILLAGCVDETDESLRAAGSDTTATRDAAGLAATAATPVTDLAVTLSDSTLTFAPGAAAAGTVSFRIRNAGSAPHALLVRGGPEAWDSGPLAPGDSLTMSVVLAAGHYELLCPLTTGGAHAERGERTDLHVE